MISYRRQGRVANLCGLYEQDSSKGTQLTLGGVYWTDLRISMSSCNSYSYDLIYVNVEYAMI